MSRPAPADPAADTLDDLRVYKLPEVMASTGLKRDAIVAQLHDHTKGLKCLRLGKPGKYARYAFTRPQVEALVASFTADKRPPAPEPQIQGGKKSLVKARY